MASTVKTKAAATAKKKAPAVAAKAAAKTAVKTTAKTAPAPKVAPKATPKAIATTKPEPKKVEKVVKAEVKAPEPVAEKRAPPKQKMILNDAPAYVPAKAEPYKHTPVGPPKAIVLTMNAHKKYAGLTEAEILKQPESSYMDKGQLAFFREKLNELRDQILHNATDTGEHLRDNEVATDPSDRATQEEEYTLELRTRDRERKLLKKVDKVIRMIDDDSFGWCEETGEPIGLPRLIARPTATLSIEAQERRERMQKLYGD
jgi:DnaK suppressor protein